MFIYILTKDVCATFPGNIHKTLLGAGAVVTTSRNDVDYIVTEYGIAHLKGRTLKDRARALINISHSSFREELIEEFKNKYKCEF